MTPSPRRTLPFSWYHDPQVFAAERERVFGRHWQYVGHVGDVAEPGSISVGTAGVIPVLLTRDQEGTLRAFVNACRHRGARLVDEPCARATVQCPYHAWTYGLDGSLMAAPRADAEPGFAKDELGLAPLAVDTWGPFVFVNPDREAGPLADVLGELPELVASAGIDVDAMRFHSRATSSYQANWKICAENFLECYHCQTAHPDLAKVLDISEDAYDLVESPWFSTQYGPVREEWTGNFDPTGVIPRGQFHFLFPNLTINIAPGAPNLSIGPILPDGPTKTTRFLDYFFAPDVDQEWVRGFLAWDDQVGVEDTALVERVQAGVSSGVLDGGVLLQSERLIHHFDQFLLSEMDGAL